MKSKMRIAVPNKGRLKQPTIDVLRRSGIEILKPERVYDSETSSPRFQVSFMRAFDIPLYVQYGAADLGFTGHDIVVERDADVLELLDVGFGQCNLVVAVPENSQIRTIEDIADVPRVATEYPNTTRRFFASNGKQVEILTVRGATELAPRLGLAEIIVDVSTTGETLSKNNLRQVAVILESSCRFVCNKIAYRTYEREVEELIDRLKGGG